MLELSKFEEEQAERQGGQDENKACRGRTNELFVSPFPGGKDIRAIEASGPLSFYEEQQDLLRIFPIVAGG